MLRFFHDNFIRKMTLTLRNVRIAITITAGAFVTALLVSCSSSPYPNYVSRGDVSKGEDYKPIDYFAMDTSHLRRIAADYVISGSNYQQQNEPARAILEFQEALRYDSAASIRYAIASSYMSLSLFDRALRESAKAIEIDPGFAPAYDLRSEAFHFVGNYPAAIASLRKAIEIEPTVQRKLMLALLLEFGDSNPDLIIEIYEDISEKSDDPYVLKKMVEIYNRMDVENDRIKNKLTDALERLTEFSDYNPDYLGDLLDVYVNMDRFDKAFDLLAKADSFVPSSELEGFYGYVASNIAADTSDAADENSKRMLDMIDGRFQMNWRIMHVAGVLAANIDDYDKSLEYFRKSINVADSIAAVPLDVYFFYWQKEKYMYGARILKDNREYFPEDSRYPFFLGLAYLNSDSLRPAADYFLEATELDSANVEYWTNLGLVYDRLGVTDSVFWSYDKALELNPEEPTANNNYAYALSQRDSSLDKALEMSEIALEAEPNNPSFLDTYGWIKFKMGENEEALDYIRQAIEVSGGTEELYEHIGDVYEAAGEIEKAIENWKKALELNPNSETLKEKIKSINLED